MIKNLTNKKKKKAFTLVEVIIVLAIIAIIAAIAIPNLTKVREESKLKADTQTSETISRTISILLTDGTLTEATTAVTIEFGTDDAMSVKVNGVAASDAVVQYLNDVKKPQGKDMKVYSSVVDATTGKVTTAAAATVTP